MQCPEVFSFRAPVSNFRSETGNFHETDKKEIKNLHHNHLISVFIPETIKVPESLTETFNNETEYYKVTDIYLSELVDYNFINNFVKKGTLSGLSVKTRIDLDDCVSIIPQKKIILSLTKDTYQRLGLEGKLSHFAKQNKSKYEQPGRLCLNHSTRCHIRHQSFHSCHSNAKIRGCHCHVVYDIFSCDSNMTMPRHRAVPTLQSLSLDAVGSFVVALKPCILATIDLYSNPQASLQNSIEWLKNILVANIPLYLYDDMAEHVLGAVKELIEQTKKSYFPHINMAKFMTEMNVVVGLTEVVLNKYLKSIDFSLWPKIMRYVLYRNLFRLTGLEILNLGSCTGGWKSSEYEKFIIDGISGMKNLRSLCLCFDCSDLIIQSLGEHCPNLQCLDVTSSRSVTDRSIPHLLKCTQLYQLQLNRTSITIKGFAQILIGLEKLQDIGRCDEFGTVLNFLSENYPQVQQLALKRIHTRDLTTEHLKLLVYFCPQVEHISLFHDEKFSDLTVLTTLYNLKDLKLLSCDFYADYMKQLLEIRGCNLTSLHLEHVEEIDLNALISISQFCPRLKNLVLYNCDFTDQVPSYNRYLKVKPFQHLERLFWVVDCALTQLEFVLLHCVNIKFIHLGSSTGICHNTMVKVMAVNPMKHLEELRILYSNDMNIETVDMLLANCPKLKVLSELENWLGISIGELAGFKKYVHSNNIDLDIRPILSY